MNVRCDPRLKAYAERHGGGMTEDDVFRLLVVEQNANVRAAIPEPYLTYQVQEAVCPSNCPVPLPWTSWNCHCDQGSTASDNDVDADTLDGTRNPDNLPACDCGKVSRKRYQICYDDDSTDDVTCESLGKGISEYGRCLIEDSGASKDWYRDWYNKAYDYFNSTHLPNWYGLGTWVSSRNQDTPWRHFEVNTDTNKWGSDGVVSFLDAQFDTVTEVDDGGNAIADEMTYQLLNR